MHDYTIYTYVLYVDVNSEATQMADGNDIRW